MKYVVLLVCGIISLHGMDTDVSSLPQRALAALEQYRPTTGADDGSQPRNWLTTLLQVPDVTITALVGHRQPLGQTVLRLKFTDNTASGVSELRSVLLQKAAVDREEIEIKTSVFRRLVKCLCMQTNRGNLSDNSQDDVGSVDSQECTLTKMTQSSVSGWQQFTYELRVFEKKTTTSVPQGLTINPNVLVTPDTDSEVSVLVENKGQEAGRLVEHTQPAAQTVPTTDPVAELTSSQAIAELEAELGGEAQQFQDDDNYGFELIQREDCGPDAKSQAA